MTQAEIPTDESGIISSNSPTIDKLKCGQMIIEEKVRLTSSLEFGDIGVVVMGDQVHTVRGERCSGAGARGNIVTR